MDYKPDEHGLNFEQFYLKMHQLNIKLVSLNSSISHD
jgi:hypothetical protein